MLCRTILASSAALLLQQAGAQYTAPDPAGLEGIIVESYYVADGNDAADTDGGSNLPAGARTYRVFVDMLDGYLLQSVGGYENHPLTFNTTTTFFYNEDRGEAWGADIPGNRLDQNTVAIDSWLTIGAASDTHWGVLRYEDTDGSIVGGANNDGGSEGTPGGLLVSTASEGFPLTVADGLYVSSEPSPATPAALGETPTIFNEANGSAYSSENFGCGVLNNFGGVGSPIAGNKVLIGQFTTDGEFSFCMNLYVKIPPALVCPSLDCHPELIFYANLLEADTAGTAISGDNKFSHPTLCFNSANAVFDCQGIANGGALPGQPCDDGDPESINDIWNADCGCIGTTGTGIDTPTPLAALIGVEPNPTTDLLRISLHKLDGAPVTFMLIDAMGRTVQEQDLGNLSGQWKGNLDLSNSEQGSTCCVSGSVSAPTRNASSSNRSMGLLQFRKQVQRILLFHLLVGGPVTLISAQPIEGIIVETYHVEPSTDGGPPLTTYRIHVDLAPDHALQVVYGDAKHSLRFETSTHFHNTDSGSVIYGDRLAMGTEKTAALWNDSWFTLGKVGKGHVAVPSTLDTDGSIVVCNAGALSAKDPVCERDGLTPSTDAREVVNYLMEPGYLGNLPGALIETTDGAWAMLGGMKGATAENTVLIAQLATTGGLHFVLNIQVGLPDGSFVRVVARGPAEGELQFDGLTHGTRPVR